MKAFLFLLSLAIPFCLYAEGRFTYQADIQSGMVRGVAQTDSQDYKIPGIPIKGNFEAEYLIDSTIKFFLKDNFFGTKGADKNDSELVNAVTGATPYSERVYSGYNSLTGGINIPKWADLRGGGQFIIYENADTENTANYRPKDTTFDTVTYYPPYYRYLKKQRYAAYGSLNQPISFANIEAYSLFTILDYEAQAISSNINDPLGLPVILKNARSLDGELFANAKLVESLSNGLYLFQKARTKFSTREFFKYDYKQFDIGIGGENDISLLSSKLAWNISMQYLVDPAMGPSDFRGYNGPNYTRWFMQKYYLRNIWSIDAGFYAKALAIVQTGDGLTRQRYEASLRKSWDNESALETGYFTNLGNYFPFQGVYLRASLKPIDAVTVTASHKRVWEWGSNTNGNKQIVSIREQSTLECAWTILPRNDIYASYDFSWFDPKGAKNFPSRQSIVLGIRSYLP